MKKILIVKYHIYSLFLGFESRTSNVPQFEIFGRAPQRPNKL